MGDNRGCPLEPIWAFVDFSDFSRKRHDNISRCAKKCGLMLNLKKQSVHTSLLKINFKQIFPNQIKQKTFAVSVKMQCECLPLKDFAKVFEKAETKWLKLRQAEQKLKLSE